MNTTVVKIGGALVEQEAALQTLWSSVRELLAECRVVLVHGGGPRATEVARQMGHEPRVIHGRRVTTELDLRIVEWTMRGELNSRLVAAAQSHGVRAVGISGADGGTLQVRKRPPWTIDGEPVDFGFVGDVASVDSGLIEYLLQGGFTPVIAPLGIDDAGQLYNVNADTVSCAIASAVRADEYLLVTDSGGVLENPDDPSSLLSECTAQIFERGVREGWIAGGMRVKLKAAFDALEAGIPRVFVVAPEGIRSRTGTRILR